MVVAEIKSWLSSNRDYDDGLVILQKYSSSPILKILATGDDLFNRNKLANMLIKLIEQPNKDSDQSDIVAAPLEDIKTTKIELPYPKRLLRLINERKSLYAEVNYLKAKTVSCPEGDGLKELAFDILSRWNRIDEIWGIQDEFNETGEMPADPAEIMAKKYEDPVFLKKSQTNLRSNISKIAGKIKKAKGDLSKVANLKSREENFERELSVVNQKLKDYEQQAI